MSGIDGMHIPYMGFDGGIGLIIWLETSSSSDLSDDKLLFFLRNKFYYFDAHRLKNGGGIENFKFQNPDALNSIFPWPMASKIPKFKIPML